MATMPTLKPSNKAGLIKKAAPCQLRETEDRLQGFTLIEMLVVLTVLALVAMVTAQNIGRRPESLVRQQAGAKLVAAIQSARREASRSGKVRSVDPASLIPGASLADALPAPGHRAGLILVYPDGSSNGGIVRMDGREIVAIDWLTGEVRDAS